MKIFQESNGQFSWRKAGTALIYILFAYLVVGYAIANKWAETPAAYMAVFYLVIAFYFARGPISKIGVKSKSDDKNAVS